MRVGIDAWGVSGDLLHTGMGQYTRHLLVWLPRIRPDLSLIAYGSPEDGRPSWLPEQVAWRSVGRRMPAKLTALHSRMFALRNEVARDRVDLFHATAVHMRPFFPPVPRLDCPVVVTLHDLIPSIHYRISSLPLRQQIFYRWNLRRAVRADGLITVSEHSRSEIASVLGIDRDRVRVIHNGVEFPANNDDTTLTRLRVSRPYLLYAGSFEPRKNLARALRAFRLLVDRGYPHLLAAVVERKSGHAPEVMAELARLGLGDRVRLLHSLDEEALRSLYSHAELLFFPSLAEGFGYPPVQAGASGLPVVASDLPVLREILGEAPLYVDPYSEEAMAAGLAAVLADAGLRLRMREIGRAMAANFTHERCAREHVQLYDQVLMQNAARRTAHRRQGIDASGVGVEL
jgi:glycosyltransferase involved in cell wall biosynthesis